MASLFSFHCLSSSCDPNSSGPGSCGPDSSMCGDSTVLQTQYVAMFMCEGCRDGIIQSVFQEEKGEWKGGSPPDLGTCKYPTLNFEFISFCVAVNCSRAKV